MNCLAVKKETVWKTINYRELCGKFSRFGRFGLKSLMLNQFSRVRLRVRDERDLS